MIHRLWAPACFTRSGQLGGSAVCGRVPFPTCMPAKEGARPSEDLQTPMPERHRPLLMVDIDGVLSLFGVPAREQAQCPGSRDRFHSIDGTPHFLSSTAAAHLLSLSSLYDLVWASGWEERANEHLPHLLGVPAGLPHLRFPPRGQTLKRPLEARGDRRLRRATAAGVDRRRAQPRLPCLGARAPRADLARGDRAPARADRARGATAGCMGAGPTGYRRAGRKDRRQTHWHEGVLQARTVCPWIRINAPLSIYKDLIDFEGKKDKFG